MVRNFPIRPIWLTLSIMLAAILVGGSLFTLSDRPAGASEILTPIDGQLAELLLDLEADQKIDILIYLVKPQVPLPHKFFGDPQSKRSALVNGLIEVNNQALAGIEPLILQESGQGRASNYRRLWIINGVQLSATREAIGKLAAHPDVHQIKFDQKIQLLNPQELANQISGLTRTWGIERIRAGHVWDGLGIDGSGVTVAIMDTGVDWNHPDLSFNYRGIQTQNGLDHSNSWFDAIEASPSPIDPNGHGTHVAGTAVGRNGIGVAPGANWIGVRVLDVFGLGQIGDIHAGFQWLLAPDGDPTQSPDIINGSWSGSATLDEFIPDIALLKEANIIPVFAAGNSGPATESVGAPAAYQGTIAVGAVDDQDILAWFSSRGPSMLTGETKPTFTAPGTHVLSADPGGGYRLRSGTSMATPHVAGLYALMLSAQPALGEPAATAIITETTWKGDGDWPNNESGWGRIDAYSAVSQLVAGGLISGSIREGAEVVAGAKITISNSGGWSLPFQSAEDGTFQIALAPGIYSMSIEKFGYSSYYTPTILIEVGGRLEIPVGLEKLPGFKVNGRLFDLETDNPISATIQVLNTPIAMDVGADGIYQIELPTGQYQLLASATGHKSQRPTIDLTTSDLELDLGLIRAPRTLLVDSGNWYYHQQLQYISSALEATDIGFDSWRIRNPYTDVPAAGDLSGYEVVVWSSPLDSPGYLNAAEAVWTYLENGGMLFITGQDVGRYAGTAPFYESWWFDQLKAEYTGSVTPSLTITGVSGTFFEDLELQLNGQDSANNQVSPDSSLPWPGSLTEVAFQYENGAAAGLQAGHCEPFKIVYLGFGLEGVSGLDNRKAILEHGYNYFTSPPEEAGLQLIPTSYEQLVARGSQIEIELEIANTSETLTDTFILELANLNWPASIDSGSLTLGPCSSGKTKIIVDVAEDLGVDAQEDFELVVSSTNSETLRGILPITLKTPGKILLVDDDRFYDQEELYRSMLEGIGIPYDFWDTDRWPLTGNGPEISLLEQYDMVLWYTGYDWFRPLTKAESVALAEFLAGGGRLFLTSQDFLYYHIADPLSRNYLGVLDYFESVEPRFIIGNPQTGIPVGPHELAFGQYQNFSDGIVPMLSTRTLAWNHNGTATAIGAEGEIWRSVFWGMPVEKISPTVRPELFRQSLGWLSWLGDSTFENQRKVIGGISGPDSINYYTATIRNSSISAVNSIWITNTLPESLDIVPGTLSPYVEYDSASRQLRWNGSLEAGDQFAFSYAATPNALLGIGSRVVNTLEIYDPELDLVFDRFNHTWLGEGDLSASSIEISPTLLNTGETGLIKVSLVNDGFRSAIISATVHIAPGVSPVTSTLAVDAGQENSGEQFFDWSLTLDPGASALASMTFTTTRQVESRWFPISVVAQGNNTDPVVRTALLEMKPYQIHLPLLTTDIKD